MLLFFIRHGDPVYNPDSLTALGKRQAEAVAKRLSMYGVDRIYSSTSTRAYQTALPTSEILKKEITQLDFAHENHAWDQLCIKTSEGRQTWAFRHPPTAQLFLSKSMRELGEHWYNHPEIKHYNFEEGIKRIQTEADNFLRSLGYEHLNEEYCYKAVRPNDDRIALFAHEGFGAAFLSCILDIPYPMFSVHFGLTHSSLTVIEFREQFGKVIPLVLTSGNDSHLYKEGILTGYQNRIRY